MAETNEVEKKNGAKTIIIRVIIGLVLCVAIYFGGKKIYYELHHESTDNAQIEANLVPILPRVSGYIKKLYPEDYATVKKDSLLVEIDDADLQLQLAEMRADLAQAQTDIGNAHAAINNTGASVTETQSNLDVAQTRKDKAHAVITLATRVLYKDEAITKSSWMIQRQLVDVADRQYEASKNDVNVAQTRIGVINAQLKKPMPLLK